MDAKLLTEGNGDRRDMFLALKRDLVGLVMNFHDHALMDLNAVMNDYGPLEPWHTVGGSSMDIVRYDCYNTVKSNHGREFPPPHVIGDNVVVLKKLLEMKYNG